MTKVVFFGSSKFILPVIQTLHEEFDLRLVVTTESLPTDAVPAYCTFAKIPFICVKRFDDNIITTIQKEKAEIGILGYFGIILTENVLHMFSKGIINIHPSLLPKYRGTTPIQTALLQGDIKSGVTIIKLDKEMDHGSILVQQEEEILPTDTAESLYQKYNIVGAQMLPKIITEYVAGSLKPTQQDHKKATYTNRLKREDGYIDMQNLPTVEQIDRMIRAYYPWPGVYTKLKIKNKISKILKLLPNKQVQLEGKKIVDVETFKKGYPELREQIEKLFKQ